MSTFILAKIGRFHNNSRPTSHYRFKCVQVQICISIHGVGYTSTLAILSI